MTDVTYGFTKNLGDVDFQQALDRVTEALKGQGFGVLTEIDVKATMKKKLGVEFRDYRILGACNPTLAHRALTSEPLIGLLLPCNAVVMEEEDGTVTVSLARPSEMFKIVGNPGVAPIADEVDAKLLAALETI